VRAWLPGILIAVGAAVFLVWGSLAKTKSAPTLDASGANVLASGIVASITDGDTLRLADNRRIRLVQIDAPELPAGECYSEQALDALTRLAPIGTSVAVRSDRALDTKDEHGRFLAYVTNGARNFNLQLVEQGAAAPYFFQGKQGQYAEDLLRAARRAQAAKRGLWGACPATNLDPSRPVNARR
jgi:endonuclease YncB( thermonuclease family)